MKIGILGLGRVGRSILSYLLDKGEEIVVYDENPQAYLHRHVKLATEQGLVKLTDPDALKDSSLIIKSPGIPNQAPWIKELDDSGVEMIDEIEFTWRELGKPMTVAVTGTNGKSTTTAWIAEVLKAGGMKVFSGGNIAPGRPFSDALSEKPYDAYVVEVSTFQLERCPTFKPNVGVLLNITADHLNRHSQEEYTGLKLSLFKNLDGEDAAVLNADDVKIMQSKDKIPGGHIFFSLTRKHADAYLEDNDLYLKQEKIISRKELLLPGLHNVANALAAVGVAWKLDVKPSRISFGLKRFSGLPHRMQYLGKLKRRLVYNNSMCTNPEAFFHSVHAFDDPSIVIAGGTEKGLPLDGFVKGVRKRAKSLILFGDNARGLKELVEKEINFSSCVIVDSLRAALEAALEKSSPGDRILFAPGFASFGNFRNFEERGHAFIKAYRLLKSKR